MRVFPPRLPCCSIRRSNSAPQLKAITSRRPVESTKLRQWTIIRPRRPRPRNARYCVTLFQLARGNEILGGGESSEAMNGKFHRTSWSLGTPRFSSSESCRGVSPQCRGLLRPLTNTTRRSRQSHSRGGAASSDFMNRSQRGGRISRSSGASGSGPSTRLENGGNAIESCDRPRHAAHATASAARPATRSGNRLVLS